MTSPKTPSWSTVFWVKSQPYSLREMVASADEALARRFVGGTMYQGYFSANSYRWRASVDGKVVEAYNVKGPIIRMPSPTEKIPAG